MAAVISIGTVIVTLLGIGDACSYACSCARRERTMSMTVTVSTFLQNGSYTPMHDEHHDVTQSEQTLRTNSPTVSKKTPHSQSAITNIANIREAMYLNVT